MHAGIIVLQIMDEQKDYLYYFWQNDTDAWLREFAYLAKDKALKGLTFGELTDGKKLVNLADFNLEELMCAQDIISATRKWRTH